MKRLIYLIVITICFSVKANAQIGNATQTGTLGVQISQVLDLAVTTGSAITFNFNTIALLDAGIEQTNAVSLTYRSNQPWYVNVQANTANFGGTSPTPMPCSVVQYRLNGGSSYTTLTTSPTSLTGTTSSKNARGAGTIGVDYKVNPGYIYSPATDYSLTITYTITTQ
jgi:spore coat protein U-like protein